MSTLHTLHSTLHHPKLHAYIAQCGLTSRRKAETLIQEGKVIVDGKTAHVGQRIIPGKQKIIVDGQELQSDTNIRYFLVYKPVGYVSTTSDELGRKNVTSLVTTNERLFPVGRLDKESEGLIILTNDGELTHQLTHPKFQIQKTYHVQIQGIPSSRALDHLKRGVRLKEGYIAPVSMKILGHELQKSTWLEIVIDEGLNQQIRRMIRRIGYDVIRLKRVKMGPFELGDLKPGKYKELSKAEIETVHNQTKE
jgi:pseudouridine synthase